MQPHLHRAHRATSRTDVALKRMLVSVTMRTGEAGGSRTSSGERTWPSGSRRTSARKGSRCHINCTPRGQALWLPCPTITQFWSILAEWMSKPVNGETMLDIAYSYQLKEMPPDTRAARVWEWNYLRKGSFAIAHRFRVPISLIF